MPVFTVHVKEPESAVSALKTTANLKHVLIIGEYDEDEEQAARVKAAVQQALPNVDVTTVVFTDTHRGSQSASGVPRGADPSVLAREHQIDGRQRAVPGGTTK